MTSRRLSWEISEDGNFVEVFVYNQTLQKYEPTLMKISVHEIKQASDSKKLQQQLLLPKRRAPMPSHHKSNLRLSATEARAFAEWFLEHAEECPAIKEHSETFSNLHFMTSHSSGIGQTIVVECTCGVSHNITDVSSW